VSHISSRVVVLLPRPRLRHLSQQLGAGRGDVGVLDEAAAAACADGGAPGDGAPLVGGLRRGVHGHVRAAVGCKYAQHNLVLHGWDELVYGAKNWLGTGTASGRSTSSTRGQKWGRAGWCARTTGISLRRRCPTGRRLRRTTSRRWRTCS
jgi:hypothetical protein